MKSILILSAFVAAIWIQSRSVDRPTPKAIEKQIKTLYVKDVAWRKIPWKTTLLEGLRESRKTNKPVILWIFIDRPFDDERC